jgi:voltage-gated potassium channel
MEGHLYGAWARRRMERSIEQLKDHFIISGFGRVGREVARTLNEAGVPFVILDVNHEALEVARAAGYRFMEEDASHDEVLRAAGVHRARGLIACADSDVNNVYVTLTARALSPTIFIVARAAYQDAEPKLYNAGANRVVSPYIMAGRTMAQMAAEPLLADYLNLLFDGRQFGVRIQELRVRDMPELAGHSVRDLHTSLLKGAFVLAIDRGEERIEHVDPDMVLGDDDRLLVVGSGEQLGKLATIG